MIKLDTKKKKIIAAVSLVLALILIALGGILIAEQMKFSKYADLPVVKIDTEGKAISSASEGVSVEIAFDNATAAQNFSKKGTIKLMGGDQADLNKKSYEINFNTAAQILGMKSAKNWVLVAINFDPTYSRDFLAFKTAAAISGDYQVSAVSVEVYLNGKYNGVYLLCEKVEIDINRVNISTSEDADTGFLVRAGQTQPEGEEGKHYFKSGEFYFTPLMDGETTTQFGNIKAYIDGFMLGLNSDDYLAYADENSLAQYFMVLEIFSSANLGSSNIYMYRDRGEKLRFSPVWDFEVSGSSVLIDGKGQDYANLRVLNNHPIAKKLMESDYFLYALKDRWAEQSSKLSLFEYDILAQKVRMRNVASRDRERFSLKPSAYDYISGEIIENASYDQAFASYQYFVLHHIAHMGLMIPLL